MKVTRSLYRVNCDFDTLVYGIAFICWVPLERACNKADMWLSCSHRCMGNHLFGWNICCDGVGHAGREEFPHWGIAPAAKHGECMVCHCHGGRGGGQLTIFLLGRLLSIYLPFIFKFIDHLSTWEGFPRPTAFGVDSQKSTLHVSGLNLRPVLLERRGMGFSNMAPKAK